MPFVKIHVSTQVPPDVQAELVHTVRAQLVSVLGLRPAVGHVVVYGAPLLARATHESRDGRFAFVEILMHPGRSREMKQALLEQIGGAIRRYTGLSETDVMLVIHEPDQANWSGGI